MAGALVLLIIVAALEFLAFWGLGSALGADRNPHSRRIVAWLYWLVSAAVLGSLVGFAFFGARNIDNEPQVPRTVIIAAIAVYLPKIGLAALTVLEFLRQVVARMLRRLLGFGVASPGWMGRTRLLPRLGLVLALLTFGAIIWGATAGRNEVRVYRQTVVCPSLPPELDGLRIAHISDIHIASLGSGAARLADRMVQAVNAEQADLIVFTGDYGEAADFEKNPEILGRLSARMGKYAVLGNHDFGPRERASDNWTSAEDKRRKVDALAKAFGSRGFTLLMNDSKSLASDAVILGVGVYDPHHGFDDADLAAAERAAGTPAFRLLIAHSPQFWESTVQGKRPIDLTLVGHTHGAQIGLGLGSLVWSPAALAYRHWGGLYREGRQYLNVNRGTGYIGLPLRVNMPADISLIVVRTERAARPGASRDRAEWKPGKDFALVEGGSFQMGNVMDDPVHAMPETPVHKVEVDSFYLSKYEVTVAEFRKFAEAAGYRTSAETDGEVKPTQQMLERGYKPFPSWKDHWFKQEENHPAIWIAWEDAVAYCNWLSRQVGLPRAYDPKTRLLVDENGAPTSDVRKTRGFRLPTEAEWEFAARERGRKVRFGNGRDLASSNEINFNASAGDYPYLRKGIERGVTTPVGIFPPNGLEIFDMAGNAWEWCTDAGALYSEASQVNPCIQKGPNHIIRGGNYGSDAKACRAAARLDWWPFAKCAASGFRVAVTVSKPGSFSGSSARSINPLKAFQ